jgi:hypothetical protein
MICPLELEYRGEIPMNLGRLTFIITLFSMMPRQEQIQMPPFVLPWSWEPGCRDFPCVPRLAPYL